VLVSTYGGTTPAVFRNELVLVATDGSQRVRRIGHHYSAVASYYDSPRASISRDGQFIAFTSNWGGTNRRDLFIARIASSNSPAPTPTPTPTPNATPTPAPTPTPINAPPVSPALVSAALTSAATLAGTANSSETQIAALVSQITQAHNAFLSEANRFTAADQIDRSLRMALYFARAAGALAAAQSSGEAVQNRLQIAASRLGQARSLISGASSPSASVNSAHAVSLNLPPVIGAATTFSAASISPVLSPSSLGTITGDAVQSPLARLSIVADQSGANALPYELAGASVSINGRAAQLLSVSPSRIGFHVPQGVPQGEVEVLVTSQDGYVSRGTVMVNSVALGLFTANGSGVGQVLSMNSNQPGSDSFDVVSTHNLGTDKRTRVMLFASGISTGAANTDTNNDVRSAGGTIVNFAETVSVEARARDGRVFRLPVEFAGAQGRMPGLDQVNVVLLAELRGAGPVDLTIIVGGQRSNSATLNVR
jgi:uncharacterized protein (TIGR03437 family)